MEAKAIAKTVRIAPRKVRLVIDLVRGKTLLEAAAILKHTPKASSMVVEKILKSAAANAEKKELDKKMLFVKAAYVDEGPTIKRYQPRAKGNAGAILKRTSHITIVLGEQKKED